METNTKHLHFGVEAAKAALTNLAVELCKNFVPLRPLMCPFNIAIVLVHLQKARGLLH